VIRRASRRGWRSPMVSEPLQTLVEGTLGATLALDLLHVLERLWKAAHVFTRRRKPGGRTLGSGPRTLRILLRSQSGCQGDSPERDQTQDLRGQA